MEFEKELHPQNSKFIHTSLRHKFDNEDVNSLNMKSLRL